MSDKIIYGGKSSVPKIGLGQFFFQRLELVNGEHTCQLDVATGEKETYKSVKERSVRAAIALAKKGVTSEDVICCCSGNTLDQTIANLGIFFLGAKVANLDPQLSVEQTRHLLSIVEPKLIFVQRDSVKFIEDCLNTLNFKPELVIFGESIEYSNFEEFLRVQPNETNFRPTAVDAVTEVGIIFFSSGSTGLPKAICHSHYSFLACLFNFDDVGSKMLLHFSSMYWISGIMMLGSALKEGSTRAFTTRPLSGQEIFRVIEQYRIDFIFVAPLFTYDLVAVPNYSSYDTSSLKYFLTGSTAISPKQLLKLQDVFQSASVVFGYGMSECGIIALFDKDVPSNSIRYKIEAGTCGKIQRGFAVKIVDPDTEIILGANQKGEIRVNTNSLMWGYYKTDSENVFDKDHFLKTGDVGYYDNDGYLYLVDRIKEMFKYKTWHVVPSAIECILLEHPEVKDAVVFGVPCGKDGDMPSAWIVLQKNSRIGYKEVEKYADGRLSDTQKLRGGIKIVENIPRTTTGKIMRKEVRNIALESIKN